MIVKNCKYTLIMSTNATSVITKGIEMTIATVISQIKSGSKYTHLFTGLP